VRTATMSERNAEVKLLANPTAIDERATVTEKKEIVIDEMPSVIEKKEIAIDGMPSVIEKKKKEIAIDEMLSATETASAEMSATERIQRTRTRIRTRIATATMPRIGAATVTRMMADATAIDEKVIDVERPAMMSAIGATVEIAAMVNVTKEIGATMIAMAVEGESEN